MKEILQEIAAKASGFVELRWHRRLSNSFVVQKGRVDVANHSLTQGVGVRAFYQGAWGFAATADVSEAEIKRAVAEAEKNARMLAKIRGYANTQLARERLSTADVVSEGYRELAAMPVADKLKAVVDYERQLAQASSYVLSARARYNEILEEKAIVTSDGAACSLKLAQPEFSLNAIAEKHGERATGHKGAGVAGGWQCLFHHPALDHAVDETARIAVDLLDAKYPEGGQTTVILAPTVVGLLCHEAVGHTVEADFVKSGSIAQGKIGQRVASDLVSLCDSGRETLAGYAVGNIPFDDEGVETETTTIINQGILTSYLHNRETAAEFGVRPTGNARAWLYNDEPLIRMRNTYMLPGTRALEEMISEVDDGYLVDGAGGGQADANGEFMFGTGYCWRIRKGKKAELLREATLSGIAFDVLRSVDAVSKEFLWDLGTGYCGKGKAAKVDAGGPYVRCRITVGGRQ